MGYSDAKLKIFTGNANPELAAEIAHHVGVPLGNASVIRFSDGEIRMKITESVRGCDVYLVQPTSAPANEHLMELLIMIDALKRASAKSINVVIPYYGYARQDRKARAREPITAKLVADLLSTAGAGRVITMDLHAGQIQGFFNIPVDHLLGEKILADYFSHKGLEDIVVVSPDMGGVTRARGMADRLGASIAIIDKRRPEPNVSEVMNVIGDIKGKIAIMIDDMIDTGGTITAGAKYLMEHGCREVYVCCTHPVLSGPAMTRLQDSVIKEVVVTNSIKVDEEKRNGCTKLTTLSIAPLIGDAIIRIHEEESVSTLFDKE
ncbi:ribose-phosphate diphosphokinase [Tumebacillus permanentifrigoris]|uniref:Ribose-phosphate pyrophosphokinase n=1 Tax=Tumebacillus permanentifrigoris TaxID=378543 RepID=A0A316D515_9BACL|nr:ribose-phosphate diphosphokinase [Tumebacillus permanentifrigoris]PWK07902.1 ribose-phosphate pyrophosphokinase [Tumebacillus permanentifrigoris]